MKPIENCPELALAISHGRWGQYHHVVIRVAPENNKFDFGPTLHNVLCRFPAHSASTATQFKGEPLYWWAEP